ncbi:DUF3027 domain-containing protein [Pseudokineococcus sp. 1T1Z-3]|uniref:DUF3027 domain-containing protein n=1 Tax=Pseudokineococcus sp. 1T1Z-3 TaxID=3132745 RepID=UPI0030B35E5D
MPPARRRRPAADAVLSGAVDLAREAAEGVAGVGPRGEALVGDHLGVRVEGERLMTHDFACTAAGYQGWRWAVTVARAPRAKAVTVCEAELLAGEEAVLAPEWLPWAQRLRPGDVGANDVLPRLEDDERLVPGFAATGEEDVDALAERELGLGRRRVLSRDGRADAAQRWYDGDHGPKAESARASAAGCGSCGFYLPLPGAMRQVFGVCANGWSPSDGTVVSVDHGCGAHSETDVEVRREQLPSPLVDDQVLDVVPVA